MSTEEKLADSLKYAGVLQDDLRELLQALGMPDGARPQSPHEVFQEALTVLRARLATLPPVAAEGEAKRWHLGAMNDGLFIINAPPRPSTDDTWPDRPDGPTMVLNVTELSEAKAQAIVDAHNTAPQPAIPPGYVLVPKVPTEEMIQAAGFPAEDVSNRRRWAVMIGRAPAPKGYDAGTVEAVGFDAPDAFEKWWATSQYRARPADNYALRKCLAWDGYWAGVNRALSRQGGTP